MKRVTSAKGRQWQRYNRWRSANMELDRQRRLERIAEKEAYREYFAEKQPCVKPRRLKAWARVSVRFGDGQSATFSIYQGPFGLTVSPTLAGKKVASVLGAKLKQPREQPRRFRPTIK